MIKEDCVEARLVTFANKILQVCEALNYTETGQHIKEQLLRCGISPAVEYGEAKTTIANKSYIHKLGNVLKDLSECQIWLTFIIRVEWLAEDPLIDLLDECDKLSRILSHSIHTAKHRRKY